MIREVDLVSYLPPFMQIYKEPVAALKAENPEFLIVWNATNRVLYNHFISTADEYGISRFEKMLEIHPTSEDTLESRRSRVQSKWFNAIPYTMKVLLQKLTVLCGGTDFTLSNNFKEGYTMTIDTDLELFGQVEELEYIIKSMFPENIQVISKNSIPCDAQGTVLFGGGICFTNTFLITNDFIEVYGINHVAGFGGGIVQTESYLVTNDSKETHAVQSAANFGGGIVETAKIQITQDFNETLQSSGTAKAASGVVNVDFIEINS
ncbi:YmfQ family protein [Lachnospiraceae bacterium OttesenSCG-928-D06]|nr:YmfQ family protein [Lachnospiraceae bacterium OttesenSCG-928-D06]